MQYEFPKNIEKYLSALSLLYESRGDTRLQSIVVNSTITVEEGTGHDNWDGGIDGHLPEVAPARAPPGSELLFEY